MSENDNPVLTKIIDGVGVMTLNRPDKFNCISLGLMEGMSAAIEAFDNDPGVRVILLNAKGKTFCTGADLDEVMEARKSHDKLKVFIGRIHEVFRRLETSPLPVVVSVNGLALAGGIEMMMACDVAFAAFQARGDAPGQEFGIALDLRHELEELLGTVRHRALFGVGRHGLSAIARNRPMWQRVIALPRALLRAPRAGRRSRGRHDRTSASAGSTQPAGTPSTSPEWRIP